MARMLSFVGIFLRIIGSSKLIVVFYDVTL